MLKRGVSPLLNSFLPRLYTNALLSSNQIQEKLSSMVAANDVVVFMKGVPQKPQCGFSNAVVQILNIHGVEKYDAHDVLADNEIREGVKEFSNWPTIPQVYFKGEFVGGCEILLNMHQSGELVEELGKIGIRSRLLDENQSNSPKESE